MPYSEHTLKEKHILIPENEWENHYKKQDEIIEELRRELSRKDVRLYIHRFSNDYGDPVFHKIGEISVTLSGGYTLKGFNEYILFNTIEEYTRVKLIDKEVVIMRDRRIQNNVNKIKSLPRIVRWLFNISDK